MSFGLETVQGIYTTDDDTITTVVSYDFVANSVADDTSAIVTIKVIGFDGSQNTIGIEKRYIVKRLSSDCEIVGSSSTVINVSDLSLDGALANLDVNGSSIEINVIGLPEVTIKWGGRIEIFYLN